MRFALGQKLLNIATAFGAGVVLLVAVPAAANSSASTAVDVLKPIEDTEKDELAKGDPAFRELFASWTSLDTASSDPFAKVVTPEVEDIVSVPSRNPLNAGFMSSGYGMRVHPVLGRRKRHKGIDLAAPTGTPVFATADGSIARADRSRSYGLVIYIDHGADLETRYAHLSKLLVADGQRVKKGDLIGYVGSTGRSTGPHLHYEVRVAGVAVNPIPYMKDETQSSALAFESDATAGERKRPGMVGGQGGQ
jgi:murein DD-endopeptidase MepM/ murein hydrolase activator NlpD